ncbi:translocation/assembly module TamB domain-containing protein [Laspinema olomoucense]|uniref:Translocation/assembly module TamB domain-containing protein n=1 Tax=Laspinema olomoucense D3b TaxID=2953688 RepID=A0ABT2N6Z9_9CYAN|nr:translocation/assembly module TamB [Laspinema sp. D3b]MCT7978256.1 translocation/assembly module TamB domain-containing protein [Laspinema sp. D3b]
MTHSPNSPQPKPDPRTHSHAWGPLLKKASLTVGAIFLVGGAAGAVYGWYFVMNQLSPLVSEELTKLIKRPVAVGPVQGFSLSTINLGKSSVPPTSTDPDRATIEKVEVSFNLWKFLHSRTLALDITLVAPDIYLEQNREGVWLETTLHPSDEEPGPIKIEVQAIRFESGFLVLVPSAQLRAEIENLDKVPPPRPLAIENVEGDAKFLDDQTRVSYQVRANPRLDTQGERGPDPTLVVSGETQLESTETQLRIQGNNLNAPDVIPLIPNLPLVAYQGRLNANLTIHLSNEELFGWQGVASFWDINAQLIGLPQNLTQGRGVLRFSDLKVGFENTSAFYGTIPAKAQGAIDTAGEGEYNLGIQILPVSTEDFINSLKLEVPLDIVGELAGEMQLTGRLEAPIVTAAVENTQPIAVDKVLLGLLRANVTIAVEQSTLTVNEFLAQPVAGGQITGKGIVPLEPMQAIALEIEARNIPADAIARPYLNSPLPIVLGSANATAKITGSAQSPTTLIQWALPQGTYPGQGEIIVLSDTVVVPNARFQVAGGTVTANGSLTDDRWRAFVNAQGVNLTQLGTPEPTATPATPAILTARIQASGNLDLDANELAVIARSSVESPGVETLTADATVNNGQWEANVNASQVNLGTFIPNLAVPTTLPTANLTLGGTLDGTLDPNNLQATANAELQTPGGRVNADAGLNNGEFQVIATTTGFAVDDLAPKLLPVQVAIAQGRVNLSGNLENVALRAIAATSQVQLTVAGNPLTANSQLSNGQLIATLNASEIPLAPFLPQPETLPVVLTTGRVNLSADLSGVEPSLNPEDILATTQIALRVGDAPVTVDGRLVNGAFDASFNAANVPLEPFLGPNLPGPVNVANGQGTVTGTLDRVELNGVNATGQFNLNIAGAPLNAKATIRRGNLQGTLTADNLQLDRLFPNVLPLPVQLAQGRVNIAGNLANLTPATLNATTEIRFNLANGTAVADARLQNGNFQGSIVSSPLSVVPGSRPTDAGIPMTLGRGRITARGRFGSFAPEEINANLQGEVQLLGGTVTARSTVNRGQFEAMVSGAGLALAQLAPNLAGIQLQGGQVIARGNLANVGPETVNATAQVRLETPGGSLKGEGRLNQGQFQGTVTGDRIAVNPFVSLPVPVVVNQGNLAVSGNIATLDPRALNLTLNANLDLADARGVATATIRNGQFDALVTTRNIQGSQLAQNVPQNLRIGDGRLAASGQLNALELQGIDARADLQLAVANGNLTGTGTVRNGQLTTVINATGIDGNQFAPQLSIPVAIASAETTIRANLANFNPLNLDATTQFQLLVSNAAVTGEGFLRNGQFQATLLADDFGLNQFAPNLNPNLQISDSRVGLAGSITAFTPAGINATAEAQLAIANGRIQADATLNNGNVSAFVNSSGIQVNQLAPDLPVLVELANADFRIDGNIQQLQPQNLDVSGDAQLRVAGGTVTSTFGLDGGTWNAVLQASELPLNALAPDLQEPLSLSSGSISLSGTADSFELADIRATGQAELVLDSLTPNSPLSPFAASISPLTSAFQWTGERLEVSQISAPGLTARGTVFVDVAGIAAPQVTGFDFNLDVTDFNLAGLPLPVASLPAQTATGEPLPPFVAGMVNFAGQITGTAPQSPQPLPFDINVIGDVRLDQFALATLEFEPVLTGPIRVNSDGVQIAIEGTQDAISVALDENFFPESFLVKAGEAIAEGTIDNGNLLNFEISQFPLAILNAFVPPEQGPVAGLLFTQGQFNLDTQAAAAQLEIRKPRIGLIQFNEIVGEISFADGVGVLNGGAVRFGQSEYLIQAKAVLDEDPNFEGRIEIARGQAEDILQTLQIFTVADLQRGLKPPEYATPETVQPLDVGVADTSLIAQLRRFSEISQLVQINAREQQAPGIPERVDIRGTLGGEITFAGSVETGVEGGFDIQGENLTWFTQTPYPAILRGEVVRQEGRTLDINRVRIRGNVAEGAVTFLPLRIEAEGSTIAFTGTLGGETQSGQLRVEQLPAYLIQDFVELPPNLEVDGLINVRANLAGTVENPQAIGEVSLIDGTINGEDIPSVQGGFSFSNSRLNFSSIAPETFQINASVPIPPGPGNNEISLDVDIQNEGLTLVNILSEQQVEWVDGIGRVSFQALGNLNVETGEIEDLVAQGEAILEKATINSAALPEPLTNVTGTARFETDRIIVEGIQGVFSNGTIVAAGILPISVPLSGIDTQVANNPLTVSLKELSVNFEELYQGGVQGKVLITGTALEPQIGGEIVLSNGQVLLPNEESQATATTGTTTTGTTTTETEAEPGFEFNELRVVLGKNLQVESPPLLSFLVVGDLTINGYLEDLRPRGTITLERGEINLFTTQFRLMRGYDNVAIFNGTLDPYIDVRLMATVPEVRGNLVNVASSSEVNEAIDTNVGRVRSVRVLARVDGLASQLNDNLELTSEPGRTEQEIVGLIGGGFINTFGQGNPTLALANIAGTTLLGDVQDAIGDALGLSEFRVGPALVDERSGDRFALEVEAGVDITRNLSASLERILIDDSPTQFSIRYRINDQIILRGSTDFDNNNRALFEFEGRF